MLACPEHFHLLVTEPRSGSMRWPQVLKQRFSLTCRSKELATWEEEPPAFWKPRYYDFNVYTERKHVEKLLHPSQSSKARSGSVT
jgi:REP element-mobilizing transposase RayT